MNNNSICLPVFETMKISWNKVKGTKGVFWAIMACIIGANLFSIGLDKLSEKLHAESMNGALIVTCIAIFVILFVIRIILQWGLIFICIQRAMDIPIRFSMLKQVFNIGLVFRMIGLILLNAALWLPAAFFIFLPAALKNSPPDLIDLMKLLSAVSYIIALILIVLTAYITIRIMLAAALVINQKSNPWTAIKISFTATKSNVCRLFALFFMNEVIILLSALPLGIGLIWSLPYAFIAYGEVYKKLIISRSV